MSNKPNGQPILPRLAVRWMTLPPKFMRPHLLASALIVMTAFGAGCRHYGPRSITADRLPYNEAIASSWQEQTLLNIVKLRYMDTPFFVDIPQITSGYTIQGTATANGGISRPGEPTRIVRATTRRHT